MKFAQRCGKNSCYIRCRFIAEIKRLQRRDEKSGSGEGHYSITQANLDKKGKTNKKLKMNTKASKYLTPKGKEIIEAAKAFAQAHPAGSGRRYKKKHNIAS